MLEAPPWRRVPEVREVRETSEDRSDVLRAKLEERATTAVPRAKSTAERTTTSEPRITSEDPVTSEIVIEGVGVREDRAESVAPSIASLRACARNGLF